MALKRLKRLSSAFTVLALISIFTLGFSATAYENEPTLAASSNTIKYDFNSASDLNSFSNFFGATWQELKMSPAKQSAHWAVGGGMLTRKSPVTPLSDATVLYLNDYTFRYFDAEISYKFNAQNGLAGLVFNANELKGWGGYNTIAYIMSDNPQNPIKGDMVVGLTSVPAGIGLGQSEKVINSLIGGRENKPDWQKMRVRVTKQTIQIYINGGKDPMHTVNIINESAISEGRIGLHSVGADISYGGFSVKALDENGKELSIPQKKTLTSGISFSEPSVTVKLGDFTKQLKPVFTPAEPDNTEVEYGSMDTRIVTVDDEGYLYPSDVGEAVIYALTADGRFLAETTVKVVEGDGVTSLKLDKNKVEAIVGDSDFILTPKIEPETGFVSGYKWSSSNPAVAIINNGKVKIMGEGKTTITLSISDSELSDTCEILVSAAKSVEKKPEVKKPNTLILIIVIGGSVAILVAVILIIVIVRKKRSGKDEI